MFQTWFPSISRVLSLNSNLDFFYFGQVMKYRQRPFYPFFQIFIQLYLLTHYRQKKSEFIFGFSTLEIYRNDTKHNNIKILIFLKKMGILTFSFNCRHLKILPECNRISGLSLPRCGSTFDNYCLFNFQNLLLTPPKRSTLL